MATVQLVAASAAPVVSCGRSSSLSSTPSPSPSSSSSSATMTNAGLVTRAKSCSGNLGRASALPCLRVRSRGASVSLSSSLMGKLYAPGLAARRGSNVESMSASEVRGIVRAQGETKELNEQKTTSAELTPSVTDVTFKELVLDSNLPVLVDFWAPWCGPCRMISPLIDELTIKYADKLKTYKMNTDECPATATSLGIRSIPTIMIFKAGRKMDTVIGAVPMSTLDTTVQKFMDC